MNLCPVCKKKYHGLNFANHVEACASVNHAEPLQHCPACGSGLSFAHKAEDKITNIACISAECQFELDLLPGGRQ